MKELLVKLIAVGIVLASGQTASAMGDAPMSGQQPLVPPHSIDMYLDGFHNFRTDRKLSKDKQLQKRYAHYCKQIKPNVFQCLIYDGNSKDARLAGVEYVVTDDVYKSFDSKEKGYWHPHDGEVDSGMLRLPGADPETEKKTLAIVRGTWGKTWNVWQPGDEFPVGEARLMWAVETSQINDKTKAAIEARAKNLNF